ncbi:hypothetical protein BN946_scf184679.g3 [Trametes cinnabarina]|uniref:RING-type domain-containing protein n=1 Tax=Pycnoporus cinnabarinus TaxID=5643 RepID=A0A060T089_PYCCI|nr:hypothetical protein BN946_scf184679.g3 [Trametes cinnabarina]
MLSAHRPGRRRSQHLAQNPLSCKTCAEHLPLGTSLEDHWRLSEQHPFCDKCEKGFQDSRTFTQVGRGRSVSMSLRGLGADRRRSVVQHAMVCSLAVQIQAQDASNAEVPSGLSEEDDRSEGSDSPSVSEPRFGPSLLFSRREEAPRSYHDEDTPSVAHLGSPRDPQDSSLAKTQREQVYQQRCLERILDLPKRKPIERPQGQDEDTTGSQASHTPTNRSDPTDASLGDDLPSTYRASGSDDAVLEEENTHSHVQRLVLGERRERRKPAPEEDDSDRTVDAQNAFGPLQTVGGARVAQPQQAHSPKDGLPQRGVRPLPPRFRALARPAIPGPVRGQMAPPVRQTNNSTQLLCGACLRPCADPVLTRCGHIFGKGCILEKLRDELKCPTCRETYFTVLEP